jgi:hypothetical protein
VSDIGLDWGPLDYLALALIIGAPGLALGAALGALLWRRHRIYGALLGAVVGLGIMGRRLCAVESESVGLKAAGWSTRSVSRPTAVLRRRCVSLKLCCRVVRIIVMSIDRSP